MEKEKFIVDFCGKPSFCSIEKAVNFLLDEQYEKYWLHIAYGIARREDFKSISLLKWKKNLKETKYKFPQLTLRMLEAFKEEISFKEALEYFYLNLSKRGDDKLQISIAKHVISYVDCSLETAFSIVFKNGFFGDEYKDLVTFLLSLESWEKAKTSPEVMMNCVDISGWFPMVLASVASTEAWKNG